MAFNITYRITKGELPIIATLIGSGLDDNVHNEYGDYSFANVIEGEYVLRVTDSLGCIKEETVYAQNPEDCVQNNLSEYIEFNYNLTFTPASLVPFGKIVENDEYIISIVNDSTDGDYKYFHVIRYNKNTLSVTDKQLTTTGGYSGNALKGNIYSIITSAGTLLVAVETLNSNGSATSPIEIFRWGDISDLDNYSQNVIDPVNIVGSYPSLNEINEDVYLNFRPSSLYELSYSKSEDDGLTWSAPIVIVSSTPSYRLFRNGLYNNKYYPNHALYSILKQYNSIYKFETIIKTNFSESFAIDGTSLGSSVDYTELTDNYFWGTLADDNVWNFPAQNMVYGDNLLTVGIIGTGSGGSTITGIQVAVTDLTTGQRYYGDIIPWTYAWVYGLYKLTTICNKPVMIFPYNGNIVFYTISNDINSVSEIYTLNGSYSNGIMQADTSSMVSVLNTSLNIITMYRFEDPNSVALSLDPSQEV